MTQSLFKPQWQASMTLLKQMAHQRCEGTEKLAVLLKKNDIYGEQKRVAQAILDSRRSGTSIR